MKRLERAWTDSATMFRCEQAPPRRTPDENWPKIEGLVRQYRVILSLALTNVPKRLGSLPRTAFISNQLQNPDWHLPRFEDGVPTWVPSPGGDEIKGYMPNGNAKADSSLAVRPKAPRLKPHLQRMAKKRDQWPQRFCLWTRIHRIAPIGKRSCATKGTRFSQPKMEQPRWRNARVFSLT